MKIHGKTCNAHVKYNTQIPNVAKEKSVTGISNNCKVISS